MIFRNLNHLFQQFIFFTVALLFPLAAIEGSDEVIMEKQARVAMRMIGHEILMSLGDGESRVLPIEKNQDHYKISFEFEFGFDPDDIVSIIDSVMTVTQIARHYLVEVEQCQSQEIVHSFEVGNLLNYHLIPCKGRVLPEDCYSLLITLLDDKLTISGNKDSFVHSSGAKDVSPLGFSFLIIPLLFLIGLISFFIWKKKGPHTGKYATNADPNLIWIGASQFDKRNMTLSFDNKKVELSNKEAELLSLLHSAANQAVERELILQKVWGDKSGYIGRTLDVFISKLRKKLEADASVKIVNIRGVGYKLIL